MTPIGTLLVRGETFEPPGPADFNLPGVGNDASFTFLGESMYSGVTKPMLQLVLAAVLVFLFFRAASAKRSMVPGRLQFVGEGMYGFVRNTLARDVIGSHDFMRYVPLLFSLFFFILLNNLFATIPGLQFPTFSRIGFVIGLALIAWLVYNGAGIRKHGAGGYLKLQTVPAGVPGYMLPLLVPLEFFSNIVVRPITLALRLFANMFAGHILLVLFSTGGLYLIQNEGVIGMIAGPLAWAMAIAVGFLEVLVQVLQAYVFALLNAMYISGALADEH